MRTQEGLSYERQAIYLVSLALLVWLPIGAGAQPAKKPNILIISGDESGTWNISNNSRGMMGYQTPGDRSLSKLESQIKRTTAEAK